MGKKEEAIDNYSKVIEINPQFADAYINRGWYHIKYLLGIALYDLGRKE